MIPGITDLIGKSLDKIFPDRNQANAAKVRMLELQQAGEFKEIDLAYQSIIAEANSTDKWTSRARPSFMYVFYFLLLASVPMGIVNAISPTVTADIIAGFGMWFKAIPEEIYWLFGSGYLGYTTARTYEKKKKINSI